MYALNNEIRIGSPTSPTYKYDNAKIALNSAQGTFSVDVLGNELSIDTFSAVVRYNPDAPLVYAPKGKDGYQTRNGKIYLVKKTADIGATYLKNLPWGTPVFWLIENNIFARGYLKQVERIARNMYKLTCISGIGLLDVQQHMGGIYNGTTAATILASIIGNTFAYTVAANVQSVMIYGWLPADNARNNLHTLLFAIGAAMLRDADGNYSIEFLSDTMTSVPQSRIALNGETQYQTPTDGVEVTEHSFYALNTDQTVTLFDNTTGAAADNLTVIFADAPVHDLGVTGTLTVSESNCNYAIVSGVGTLTGKKYTHNTQIISAGSGKKNLKRVENNTLVSFANSRAVARRVLNYFAYSKTIDAKIMLDGEKTGQLLALTDSFGDATNAYLQSMNVLVTSVKGAQCKLIAGFVPGAGGNNYSHRVFISASGTWTVPAGITQIRVVLIGGGNGGQGGYDGENTQAVLAFNTYQDGYGEYYGIYGYANAEQPAAKGGSAGSAGSAGKYLIVDSSVNGGETLTFGIGAGGAGGARNGGAGSAGGATTVSSSSLGSKSSANGASGNPYYDAFADATFCINGTIGYAGGDGGQTDTNDLYGWRGGSGRNGKGIQTWSGGVGGAGYQASAIYGYGTLGSGGGGGGAAYGANGGAGGAAVYTPGHYTTYPYYVGPNIKTGNGGNGANAVAPNKATYGNGGRGGNGGGGAGNIGGGTQYGLDFSPSNSITAGTGGTGGHGSVGGAGGDGCVIIYY